VPYSGARRRPPLTEPVRTDHFAGKNRAPVLAIDDSRPVLR
jgi:hypothetical protein